MSFHNHQLIELSNSQIKSDESTNIAKTQAISSPSKTILSRNSLQNIPQVFQRKLYLSSPSKTSKKYGYPLNQIKTSKYTFYNFFPLTLFLQFRRYANIYFLILTTIQCIPKISPLNPVTAVLPLIFVLLVSIVREGLEDIKRHNSDKKENEALFERFNFNTNNFERCPSEKISVGDYIKIYENEVVPADIIVIHTSNKNKISYVMTSGLDGEKNLKPKQCNPFFYKVNNNSPFQVNMRGKIYYTSPQPDLSYFKAKVTLGNIRSPIFLDASNTIYRGSLLKNTAFTIGIVVYTGRETKIYLNSLRSPSKQSHLERKVNIVIAIILCLQISLCIILSVLNSFFYDDNENLFYLELKDFAQTKVLSAFYSFWTFLLLLNTMIPVSLIVTLEIVKYIQALFVNWDIEMYSKEREHFAECNSCSLNEELGQIQFIFSDKTGTLTANKLNFVSCTIGNTIFNKSETIVKLLQSDEVDIDTKNLMKNFFFCLCVNHTLFADKKGDSGMDTNETIKYRRKNIDLKNNDLHSRKSNKSNKTSKSMKMFAKDIYYTGESPDEVVLCSYAKECGFIYLGGDQNYTFIRNDNDLGKVEKFKILNMIKYTSQRGKMTIIINNNGKIILYCKGSNEKLKLILRKKDPKNWVNYIEKQSELYSGLGLRVLWMGMKELTEQEYEKWKTKFDNSNESEDLINEIESNLELIGCTAVEDKLQEEVPETIESIRNAKIKIWMLTGDNLSTAKNIALSCKMISFDDDIIELCEKEDKFQEEICDKLINEKIEKKNFNEDTNLRINNDIFHYEKQLQCMREIENFEKECDSTTNISNIAYETKSAIYLLGIRALLSKYEKENKKYAMVIESSVLSRFINTPNAQHPLTKAFLELSLKSLAVICCRISPKQKSSVVSLIKNNISNCITLSIGDGANDVAMIKTADVGVGIYGEEGTHAARSADYAISEFRHLSRLLFRHGRLNYIRNSEMINYFFYKNLLFTFLQFLINIFNGFSGQSQYDDWYITFYNLVFTCLPLLFTAIQDQDIPDVKDPREILLYHKGQQNEIFNAKAFTFLFFKSITFSTFLFFGVPFALDRIVSQEGYVADYWTISLTKYTCVFLTANFRYIMYTRYWTWLNFVILFGTSYAIYAIYFYASSFLSISRSKGTSEIIITFPLFYLTLIFFALFGFVWEFIGKAIVGLFSNDEEYIIKREGISEDSKRSLLDV